MIEQAIADLLGYALRVGLIEDCDRTWAANRLLEALELDNWEEPGTVPERPLEEVLKDILDWAVENGRIEEGTTSRDLFDTELMGTIALCESILAGRGAVLAAAMARGSFSGLERLMVMSRSP